MTLYVIAGFILLSMQTAKGSIEGLVVSATTNQPIAGAQVTGMKSTGQPGMTTVVTRDAAGVVTGGFQPMELLPATTDSNGHFVIQNVEPGTYFLNASADRYARQQIGPRPRGQTGMSTSVTVVAGQPAKDIVFHLMPAGTVTGRVLGESDQPVVNVQVGLFSTNYTLDGKRNLLQMASGQTDDRGVYRLFWVPPGRYYLTANPSPRPLTGLNPLQPSAASNKYPRTYYPGTTDIDAASEVDIRPGSEVEGIDIRLAPHATYRIRGRIVDPATGAAPQGAAVSIIRRDQFLGGIFPNPVPYNAADGTFEARDVLPGSYWVSASFPRSAPGPRVGVSPSPGAAVPVEVTAADIDDVVLSPQLPITIAGRVGVEGNEAGAGLNSMTIRLAPTEIGSRLGIPPQPAQVNTDGRFQIVNVTPGEYQLLVPGLGPRASEGNLYVKEARLGSIDVRGDSFRISGANPGELEIVFGQDGSQINGSVVDDQRQPVPLCSVVLLPVRSERRDLYRFVSTDASGRFTLRPVPPGAYKVLAIAAEYMLTFLNPTVRRQLEETATTLTVGPSSNLTLDLKLTALPASR